MKLNVILNGTDTNPFHQYGLTQNPFPQIAIHRYSAQCLQLQKLGGNPIPDTDYIRDTLKGWSQEFIELCVSRFRKGEMVEFEVQFQE